METDLLGPLVISVVTGIVVGLLVAFVSVFDSRVVFSRWAALRRVRTDRAPSVRDRVSAGIEMYRKGNVAEAIDEFERALQEKPEMAEADVNLGMLLHNETLKHQRDLTPEQRREDFLQARRHFEQALHNQPADVDSLEGLGDVDYHLSILGESEPEKKAAIDRATTSLQLAIASSESPKARTHNRLGLAYVRAARLGEHSLTRDAVHHLSIALEKNPEYVAAHNNLGLAWIELGELDKAKRAFDQALALKPDYGTAYLNLARIAAQTGEADEACRLIEKGLEMSTRPMDEVLDAPYWGDIKSSECFQQLVGRWTQQTP